MQNKRGQFYLIAAIVIIIAIMAFVSVSNTSKQREFTQLEVAKEELEIEGQAVLDYAAYKDLSGVEIETLLTDFARDYSAYSSAENSYFLFGDTTGVTVTAYQRAGSGRIFVNVGSEDQEFEIEKNTYTTESYEGTDITDVTLTINEVGYDFEIKQGKNLYFILLEAKADGDFVFTGSLIKEGM